MGLTSLSGPLHRGHRACCGFGAAQREGQIEPGEQGRKADREGSVGLRQKLAPMSL